VKRRTPSSVSVDRPPSTDVVFSVLLVLVAFGMLYLYNLGGWLINDDEGSFLYQVWRISQGQRPYQDLFSSRWPLFLYTGGWWMRVFGATAVPMRVLSVGLTLGTAVLVFSMARQILPTRAALLSLIVFLVHPDVFLFGRSFQPEPFYLFFSMLGMFLVTRGRAKGSVPSFLGAGVVFAVASLYKLLTVWVLMGCMLFLGVTWWRNRGHRRQVVFWALALLLPFGVVFGLVVGGFTLGVPRFYDSVVGVNLAQGQELSPLDVVFKGIAALVVHFFTTPLLLLALPAAWRGWRGDQKVALFGWQLPTVLIFLFLSRDIFPRLLLYLVPSLSILFVATVEPIRRLSRRSLLLLAVVGSLVVPWLMSDFLVLMRSEQATMSVVRHIQAWTPPDAYVLSDYQELNFHARRLSTYLGAELSHVILAGGTVRGTDLIAEIESSDVRMVIVDVSPLGQHIVHLPDYGAFRAYLEQHFTLLDVLPREGQLLEVYYREP
jgi:4-amino-4-deoxy-L-arabinose transferase-like glycosyltransferase